MRHSPASVGLALNVMFVVAACAGLCQAGQQANLLLNGGAEQGKVELPSVWLAACVPVEGLRMWWCTERARTEKACLAISNEHQYDRTVSNNWAQRLQTVPRGKAIQLKAAVRTENADAANVCVQCWSPDAKTMLAFASTPILRGTRDWIVLNTRPIVVPQKTAFVMVRAALTGQGRAFFDDISLTMVAAPATASTLATSVPSSDELATCVDGAIVCSLPAKKDCMVLAYMPDWAHGHVDNLAVANNQGGVRTLVAWQAVPPAQASHPDRKFLLALYSRGWRLRPPPGTILVHKLLQDWPERTSWKTLPRFDPNPITKVSFAPGEGWKVFDVTSLIRAQAQTGREPHGVLLRFEKEDRAGDRSGYQFVSREGLGKWKPFRPVLAVVEPSKKPPKSAAAGSPRPDPNDAPGALGETTGRVHGN